MGMTVYFLRHGQTWWNAAKRMQGQVDVPLNDIGRGQARDAAGKLPAIDLCLTSPLGRARETARLALRGADTPIVVEPLLLEQSYGVSEGKYQPVAYHNPFDPLFHYGRHPERYRPPLGGESFDDLCRRAQTFLDRRLLPLEKRFDTVLVSAHGAFLCAVFRQLQGTPMADFWSALLPNGGVRAMSVEDGRRRLMEAPVSVRP